MYQSSDSLLAFARKHGETVGSCCDSNAQKRKLSTGETSAAKRTEMTSSTPESSDWEDEKVYKYEFCKAVKKSALNKESCDLYRRILKRKTGIETIPLGVKDRVSSLVEESLYTVEDCFLRKSDAVQNEEQTDDKSDQKELECLYDACKAAVMCQEHEESKIGWDCQTHHPLLKAALAPHKDIQHLNVNYSGGFGFSSSPNIVDFAVLLQPDELTVEAAIRVSKTVTDINPRSGTFSINPLQRSKFQNCPIAFVVKTIPPYMTYNQVKHSLAAFAVEHLSEMQKLVDYQEDQIELMIWEVERVSEYAGAQREIEETKKMLELPAMPILFARGAEWSLCFAKLEKHKRVFLLGPVPIGDATSLLDVYKIVASIRELCIWAQGSFRDWFNRVIHAHHMHELKRKVRDSINEFYTSPSPSVLRY